MVKPVLQTRFIGMQPDASGHPLAPMELVYSCEEPPPQKLRWRTWLAWALALGGFILLRL